MTSEPSTSINFAFPNPFNPSENGDLFFPAPDNSRVYEDALLVVYGTDMVPIVSEKGKISVYNTKKVLTFDQIGNNLQDGIYFYGVHTKDKQSFGKFTVTRK